MWRVSHASRPRCVNTIVRPSGTFATQLKCPATVIAPSQDIMRTTQQPITCSRQTSCGRSVALRPQAACAAHQTTPTTSDHRPQHRPLAAHAHCPSRTELPAAIQARVLWVHMRVAVQRHQASGGDWSAYAADISRRNSSKHKAFRQLE